MFSDEKIFTVDGVFNRQNERVWAVSRAEADKNGGIHRANKFPEKIMVFLAVCSNGVSSVVMFDNEAVNHENYIHRCLPVARRLGNRHFGNNWTFQQDGARAHTAANTQEWCTINFPSFIEKDRWPANSPDLNPLDYSVWNEVVQAMRWDKVKCKSSLKSQIQAGVNKIRPEVLLDICANFYSRIRRLARSDGAYLR